MERLVPRPAIRPLWAFPAATRKEPEPIPPKRSLRLRPYKRVREGSMGEVVEAGIKFLVRVSILSVVILGLDPGICRVEAAGEGVGDR